MVDVENSKTNGTGASLYRQAVGARAANSQIFVNYRLPLVRVTVVTLGAKLIESPDEALTIACRNEPGPLSFPLVTVMVAASVSLALTKSAAITQNR